MDVPQPVDRDASQRDRARRLLWPVSVATFLFTVSYPARDYATATNASGIGAGMLTIYVGIALVTVGAVFALVLPWALRRDGSGGVALAISVPGTLLAPGFWTGFPPGLATGGALLGWAGLQATRARRLSQAAFVIGLLGVLFNIYSYVDVFI